MDDDLENILKEVVMTWGTASIWVTATPTWCPEQGYSTRGVNTLPCTILNLILNLKKQEFEFLM